MFMRLRETYRILSHRETDKGQHIPDIRFVEEQKPSYSASRLFVSRLVQIAVAIYVVGIVSTPFANAFEHLLNGHRSPSATTVAGGMGALLVIVAHFVRRRVEGAINTNLNLAPFFGRRVENAVRTLKGIPRAI